MWLSPKRVLVAAARVSCSALPECQDWGAAGAEPLGEPGSSGAAGAQWEARVRKAVGLILRGSSESDAQIDESCFHWTQSCGVNLPTCAYLPRSGQDGRDPALSNRVSRRHAAATTDADGLSRCTQAV